MTAIAVTIAGSDSGGGAGIQADLKTFSALGVYGASVVTALTAQNTRGVSAIHDVPADFVSAQMDAVFSDLAVDAVKIGMLSQVSVIEAVAEGLGRWPVPRVVLDPVMVAESGDPLIADEAVDVLRTRLFARVAVVTPNLREAARLLGTAPATTRDEMQEQALALLAQGCQAVLVKGGHFADAEAADVLAMRSTEGDPAPRWFTAPRHATDNTHGTGCSLSSAIAAHLAQGLDLPEAVEAAKAWLTGAIAGADSLAVGEGAGPVHHFHQLWDALGEGMN